ncbi:unnamed protein product [Caenorhabditis sp. 36 PRJEB53466]|nr:unnamed protein product [Caenorhabditis sp. 36 PRJEB53466]
MGQKQVRASAPVPEYGSLMSPTPIPPPRYNRKGQEEEEEHLQNPLLQPEVAEIAVLEHKLCGIDVRSWLLAHTVLVTLLLIPAIIASAFFHALIIVPFSYNALLLFAALWRKIPALQAVKVFAYILLATGILSLPFLPFALLVLNKTSNYYAYKGNYGSCNFIKVYLLELPIIFSIPLHIVNFVILSQIYLVNKVLDVAKSEQKAKEEQRLRLELRI